MHEAEQRHGRGGRRLRDEERGAAADAVGQHARADRGGDAAEAVEGGDEAGVGRGVAAVEGQVQGHERRDERAEPVDQGAGPQPPELAGQAGDGLPGGASQGGE